ncbi:signal peptide peptidase SppA [Bradyrhizobium elkanii]|uniref:S49 family peptidase n=1 Tax=Bradyrhizobium elkanii TaxID=29448 RepID=UPI0010202536|nr:S49 family peptidase [Bradyrhizobium elkanii]NWL40363.1 S49 family peptidase [Bradyrhizobium elkanii]RYM21107.1 S49 family peptidase [Bradyrhizobium elkanii]
MIKIETGAPDLRQVLSQVTSIDALVALEVGALADCLARAEQRQAIMAAAAAQAASSSASKIALVAVMGALTPRGSWYGSSLSDIASQVARAADDQDVAGIVINVDSPGGTVSGTVEAASAVAAAAAKKPVVAIANTLAASAAYWIASQASELVMTPSADVGSIGAMIMHQDISGWLDQVGIKMTIVRSEQSPNKNEAHPFAPLSDEAKAYLQARANEAGADFVKAVASGRRVSQTKVREEFGQGRMVGARDAVARGMADRIATLDQVIGVMLQQRSSRTSSRRRSALAFE